MTNGRNPNASVHSELSDAFGFPVIFVIIHCKIGFPAVCYEPHGRCLLRKRNETFVVIGLLRKQRASTAYGEAALQARFAQD